MNAKNKTAYWVTTGLFSLVYFGSGIADVAHAAPVAATLASLGYPLFLASILGPWKIAGVATLLAPRFPRLKEWAYAGIAFDLTGALFSHTIHGDPIAKLAPPIVLLGLSLASYFLRPESRKLPGVVTSAEAEREPRLPLGVAATAK